MPSTDVVRQSAPIDTRFLSSSGYCGQPVRQSHLAIEESRGLATRGLYLAGTASLRTGGY